MSDIDNEKRYPDGPYMVVDHTSLANAVEFEGNLNRHAENGWNLSQTTERFSIFER